MSHRLDASKSRNLSEGQSLICYMKSHMLGSSINNNPLIAHLTDDRTYIANIIYYLFCAIASIENHRYNLLN